MLVEKEFSKGVRLFISVFISVDNAKNKNGSTRNFCGAILLKEEEMFMY
jgi:hypothetical protein